MPPPRLYKYSDLGKYGRRKIEYSELFFASPKTFNDPFDCRVIFDFQGDRAAQVACVLEAMQRPILLQKRKAPPTREDAERFVDKATPETWARIGDAMRDTAMDYFGVLPLSAKGTDLLMFAHYGDQHQGVCLEFDTARTDFFASARPVEYSSDYPTVPYVAAESPEDRARKYQAGLFMKSSEWAYEEEWRVVRFGNQASAAHQFPKETLTAVILGCRMRDDKKSEVDSLLRGSHPDAALYEARAHSNRFQLVLHQVR